MIVPAAKKVEADLIAAPENRQNVEIVGTKKVRKQLSCAEKKNKMRTTRIKFIFQKSSLKNNLSCKDFFTIV